MKILFVTETLREGGAEIFLLRLARALQQEGVQTKILLLEEKEKNPVLLQQFRDLRIISLPASSRFSRFMDRVLFSLRSDYSLVAKARRKKIRAFIEQGDIVHTHYPVTDWTVAGLREQLSFFHVVTVHGDYSAQYYHAKKHGRSIWNNINKKLAQLAQRVDKWILLSGEQQQFSREIMGVEHARTEQIYNGVAADEDPGHKMLPIEGNFKVCMAGRAEPGKGWEKAIGTFLKMPADCRLYLAGQGEHLEKLRLKYKAGARIQFLGFLPSPQALFKHCDVSLMPTELPYESLPNVISESLVAGTPVIASATGEIPQMLMIEGTSKCAGILLPVTDGNVDEGELYAAMKKLYDDRGLLQQLKSNTREAANKFDMSLCARKYINMYQQLTGNDLLK
jgi:glycosyltransferase involved in cell wall biosynthesis